MQKRLANKLQMNIDCIEQEVIQIVQKLNLIINDIENSIQDDNQKSLIDDSSLFTGNKHLKLQNTI